jgi:hypothetical protein
MSRLGVADVFVHDGRETGPEMRFAVDYGWTALRRGGALVLANVETSGSLQYFHQRYPGCTALVCEAQPERVDPNRRHHGGIFAVVFKNQPAS